MWLLQNREQFQDASGLLHTLMLFIGFQLSGAVYEERGAMLQTSQAKTSR
jgi:hypothetical protein